MKGLLLLSCLSWFCGVIATNAPTAMTPLGEMMGSFLYTRQNRKIEAFTAIPYAAPPIGDLRFKGPVPIKPWDGVLDASVQPPVCVQRNPYIRQAEITGQEDCLYLNVYTPRSAASSAKELLPVMMFIHGGGWMCGDSTTYMYGPEFLLDQDVVFVTINYRLGPLGFLSTQDEHCPGNNGLKDQQEALRWIQRNIYAFGGNNNSVTIFGESAGGASVHYHMISETSAGLFHRGISESGTGLVPWAEAAPGEPLKNAFRLAKLLRCPQAPSQRMISCLRTKSSYDIINTEFDFYAWDYEAMTPFKAVVEPDLPGAFLTRSPREVPNVPAVPWMTGLNSDEGCLKSVWITANSTRFEEFLTAFDVIAPVTFYYENTVNINYVTKLLREKYLNNDNQENIKTCILHAYSDSYFDYPLIEAVDIILKYSKNPVYLYQLAYKATNSFSQIFGDPDGDYGVCHADELMHLFPIHFLNKPFSEEDKEMSKLIVNLWTNFATSGDPNYPEKIPTKWLPATNSKQMEHLSINRKPKMDVDLASRSRFWGTLPLWHSAHSRRFIDEL